MTMDYRENGGLLVPDNAIGIGAYTGTIIRGGYFDDDGVWHRGKEIVDHFVEKNLLVAQGLTSMLGVYLHADTQLPSWYIGLFEGNYTPVDGDLASNIATNATETTAYVSATRPQFVPAAAATKSITNSASRADFVFNAGKTIYGAFMISDNAKNGVAGTLLSVARFAASKTVASSDELLLTYSFTLASA
jgi:hypothetical protein